MPSLRELAIAKSQLSGLKTLQETPLTATLTLLYHFEEFALISAITAREKSEFHSELILGGLMSISASARINFICYCLLFK